MSGKKRITMETLAKELGCSKSTISRAISGKGRMNPETKKKILKYCELSGYRTGAAVDNLLIKRSYNLVVILPSEQELSEIPFFYNCMIGISEAAKERGYSVILLSLRVGELQPLKTVLDQNKADGVILMRTWVADMTVDYLMARHVPFVAIGSSRKYSVQYVDHDTVRACKELTSYLIGRKYNSIALIGGDTEHTVTQKRLAGFREGFFLYHRIPDDNLIYLDCNTKEEVYETAEKMLDHNVECVVCMDDRICCQVLEKFQNMRVSIPKDIKMASFYDSYFLAHSEPSVTSIKFDEVKLGILACENLVSRIERMECRSKIYEGYRIIPRTSTM